MSTTPAILLTIGTDFHRFDRIVDWLDNWLERNSTYVEQTLVQHGSSRASRYALSMDFIPYAQLLESMSGASVVIVHGGPASIFEARSVGRLPICVPRDPARQEIVDAHQQMFSRYLATKELIRICEEEGAFYCAMDEAMSRPGGFAIAADKQRFRDAVAAVTDIVDDLVRERRDRVGSRARRRG